jgi:hypothetical protein
MSLQIPHRERASGADKDTKAIILVSILSHPVPADRFLPMRRSGLPRTAATASFASLYFVTGPPPHPFIHADLHRGTHLGAGKNRLN